MTGSGIGPRAILEPILFSVHGSILPTSLAYIVPSTRGCSPWRPDAVMSTTGRERHSVLPDFQGRGAPTPRDAAVLFQPAGPTSPSRFVVGGVVKHERFARQYRCGPPPEFPLASPRSGIVHHLSGPDRHAHTRTLLRRSRAQVPWDGALTLSGAPFQGTWARSVAEDASPDYNSNNEIARFSSWAIPGSLAVTRGILAQLAFKDSMVHGILQFTPSIAFRYVLHRCKSRDIRCRESFSYSKDVHANTTRKRGRGCAQTLFNYPWRVLRRGFDNDPSAGSPTETLLRLLLPLNDKVQWTSRDVAGSEPPTSPRSEHFTGPFNR
ncbi:hypothetical protein RHMOL_RhmolUnG0006500 [Rhododendron molle]|nr:hypothetical protein RHMOL_RhmolUnG0006500 [Rhododendron molle]